MPHNTQKILSSVSLEMTQANCPALKHFFPCNEEAGSATLTDTVGGVVAGGMNITSGVADNSIIAGQSAHTALASGSWESPNSKVAIFLGVGIFPNNAINIGRPNGVGGTGSIQLIGAASSARAGDGTDQGATSGLTISASDVEAHSVVLIPNTSVTAYRLQDDGTFGTNGTADVADIPTITDMDGFSTMGNSGIGEVTVFAWAVFYFDALPTDLEAAIKYMKASAVNDVGMKLWPAWKDKV